jgi:hypothetical protein
MLDPSSLEVRFDNFNHIRSLFGRLRIPRHAVADMILQEFRHDAVGGPSRRSQTLKNVRAMLIFVQARVVDAGHSLA